MTRLFGVIGDPIDHSLSPVMHTASGSDTVPTATIRLAKEG